MQQGAGIPYVFFFVRHFNDIDNMMPVAYKFTQSNRGRPVVLVMDPFYNIEADYRFRFLQERYNVPVVPVLGFHPLSPFFPWFASLLRGRFWRGFLKEKRLLLLLALRKLFYGKRWAGRILDRYNPAALVFEWCDPSWGVPGVMLPAGRDRGIPSISVPHGMNIWTNELVNRQEQQDGRISNREYYHQFDRLVVQSNLHAERHARERVRKDKIAVLGSARYCDEWQQINLEIQPERFTPRKGGDCTFRAVFMLPQWNYNSDLDTNMQTLRRLSKEPWLHLVLKPHTREVEAVPSYLREFEDLPNVEVAGAVGSVALIQWADAVIVVGSSIALEVLRQGKVHLNPTYLLDNTTVFEDTGAEWTLYNGSELEDALKRLSEGQQPPYGEEQVSKAISLLVLGSATERDVLGRYVDFIAGGWRQHPTYQDFLGACANAPEGRPSSPSNLRGGP